MKKIWLLMIVCLLVPFGTQAREIILSAGGSFCYAVDADGTIWGWGDNTKGQLGNGTKKRAFYPQQAAVTLNGNDVLAIDCGNENALFLLSDGTVWTCGPNNYGQQGSSEAPAYAYEPIRIPGLENIVQISSGWGHCMARTADGKLYGWGRNTGGQVGNGTTKNDTGKKKKVTEPVRLETGFSVREIACGGSTAYALSEDGKVYAWGRNDFWQLGIKDGKSSKVPVEAQLAEGLKIRDIYAYNTHAALVTEEGSYWTWGMMRCGQLGNGKHPSKSLPVECEIGVPVLEASMGSSGSYIVKEDGTVWANGYGEVGQTGAYPKKTGYVYVWKWTGLNLLESTWTDPKN